MFSGSWRHRTLLVALASLALSAPAALARPAETPAGTTGWTLERHHDPYPEPTSLRDVAGALAQERWYSTPREPAAPSRVAATDAGDGIAWAPFALAVFGALVVGMGAGSALHLVHSRRHPTRLAT